MKRIAIGVQYDGTAWHGYQKQEDGHTVQDKLEQALEKFATVRLATTCAGRTDTGVHALEQVVHFDTDLTRDAGAFAEPGFDDSGWTPVDVVPVDRAILEPRISPPVRVVDERPMARTEHADRVLSEHPFALLAGMMLDQQFPMERAFAGPGKLVERLGGLDPVTVAQADPETFVVPNAGEVLFRLR